jgi:adenylate cyclase
MKQSAAPFMFGLLLALAAIALLASPLGVRLEEDLGLAVLFKLRGPLEPPDGIVIVNVDEESAERFGYPENPFKWPRDVHAELIQRLVNCGAAVIVFDVHFADAKEDEEDLRFAEAIRRAGNVILVQRLLRRQVTGEEAEDGPAYDLEVLVSPIPVLAESCLAMAPFTLPKVPVRVNQAWTFKNSMGSIPTLPVVALQSGALTRNKQFFTCLEDTFPEEFGLSPTPMSRIAEEQGLVEAMRQIRLRLERSPSVPTGISLLSESCNLMSTADMQFLQAMIKTYEGNHHVYVNFYGPPSTLPTISMHKLVLMDPKAESRYRAVLKDKVVFVGAARTSWSEQKDGFHTVFTRSDGLDLSGVEIAATVFANLRDDSYLKALPFQISAAVLLSAALIVCLISFPLSPLPAAAALLAYGGAGLAAAWFLFAQHNIWTPVIIPLVLLPAAGYLSTLIHKYLRSRRERKHMQRALELYLPENVVEEISRDLDFVTSGDRMIYGACLLSDAENYTTLSERLAPEELSRLMKDYYGILFGQVKEHGGTVTNMIGDSMFALWPSTEPKPELKTKACQAALGIIEVLGEFNQRNPEHALPTRIGLHSGYLLMGHIGAAGHYEYAPVGDIVNTASRIEGLNKKLGTRVLASEDMLGLREGFYARFLGSFLLSGKSHPVTIHQILGDGEMSDAVAPAYTELFPTALELFKARRWQQAEATLARCLELLPNDGPSHFYLELCRSYRRKPPAAEWQGVISVGK